MKIDRRDFLRMGLASVAATASVGVSKRARAEASPISNRTVLHAGCLVDTTLCIGCRKCEEACNRSNRLPQPEHPFSDRAIFREYRRMSTGAFTVVNAYPGQPSPVQNQRSNTYVKFQCMHCLDPACVSACIVAALTVAEDGPVVYNPRRCLGCRYCMVACPFGVPAYEYHDPIAPRLRKCEFCANREEYAGARPACAAACPMEAIVFGERQNLLELARQRIDEQPDRYLHHIYGENEVGGTSWLYLAGRPHEEIGLPRLPRKAPPRTTEAIQHGIFRYAAIPTAVYLGLAAIMWSNSRRGSLPKAEGG